MIERTLTLFESQNCQYEHHHGSHSCQIRDAERSHARPIPKSHRQENDQPAAVVKEKEEYNDGIGIFDIQPPPYPTIHRKAKSRDTQVYEKPNIHSISLNEKAAFAAFCYLRIHGDVGGVGHLAVGLVVFHELDADLELFGLAGGCQGDVDVGRLAGGGLHGFPRGRAGAEDLDLPCVGLFAARDDDGEMCAGLRAEDLDRRLHVAGIDGGLIAGFDAESDSDLLCVAGAELVKLAAVANLEEHTADERRIWNNGCGDDREVGDRRAFGRGEKRLLNVERRLLIGVERRAIIANLHHVGVGLIRPSHIRRGRSDLGQVGRQILYPQPQNFYNFIKCPGDSHTCLLLNY